MHSLTLHRHIKYCKLQASYILTFFIVLLFSAGYSADIIEIMGGMKYRGWVESDSVAEYCLILSTSGNAPDRRKPIHVAAVVDVSRPMEGIGIDATKKALHQLIDGLKDQDMITIISTSEEARTEFALKKINDNSRRSAKMAVQNTAIRMKRDYRPGIETALKEFETYKHEQVAGRYILFFTGGNKESSDKKNIPSISDLALKAREKDVSISVFGIEENFIEDPLMDLAVNTYGRYYFIFDSKDILVTFTEEFNRISHAIARKVALSMVPPKGTRIDDIAGGFSDGEKIYLGDLASNDTNLVLFTLYNRPQKQRDCELEITHLDPESMIKKSNREYLSVPLSGSESDLDPEYAARLIMYDFYDEFAEAAHELKKNRKQYGIIFRDKLLKLEQENVILNSDYIRASQTNLEKLQEHILRASIDEDLVIKEIKYQPLKMLHN